VTLAVIDCAGSRSGPEAVRRPAGPSQDASGRGSGLGGLRRGSTLDPGPGCVDRHDVHLRVSITTAWHAMRRLGYTAQLPIHRAVEWDEAAIAHWRRYQRPAVRSRRPHGRQYLLRRLGRCPADTTEVDVPSSPDQAERHTGALRDRTYKSGVVTCALTYPQGPTHVIPAHRTRQSIDTNQLADGHLRARWPATS
jgi:hypothetical protein